MAKEKSGISRRNFLKIAGVSGGAAAAATVVGAPAVAPVNAEAAPFSDPAGRPKRPWWVRTVDKPTIEIDWDKMERFNERYDPKLNKGTVRGGGFAGYVGADTAKQIQAAGDAKTKQRVLDNEAGYTIKDMALYSAHSARPEQSFLGNQKIATPADRGVPNWTGTPEEAAKMLRAAMRHFGAGTVGFVELNDQTRKLIYSVDPDGKQLVFADVDQPEEGEKQRVIPNSYKWVIVWTIQMSGETLKRAPTPLGAQTTALTYAQNTLVQNQLQDFLRGIGYQGLGESSTNALGISPAFAVMAGLGEMSRLNRLVTPEFGPMQRVFKMVINLPVAADKPINAGIMEFCAHCKKCAEACPSGALSFEDGPTWETKGPWNNPGHKAYFEDSVKCMTYWKDAGTNCGICFSVCPFAKEDKAWIHDWIKASIASAPVMDGFIRSMDDAFGYGAQKSPEEWWNLDLPEYGRDSYRPVKEG